MVEVNGDNPMRHCTLHRKGCHTKPKRKPPYKGFGSLERYGGWLPFLNEAEARAYYEAEWQPRGYGWVDCSYCRE
jgi:hypothetical protein